MLCCSEYFWKFSLGQKAVCPLRDRFGMPTTQAWHYSKCLQSWAVSGITANPYRVGQCLTLQQTLTELSSFWHYSKPLQSWAVSMHKQLHIGIPESSLVGLGMYWCHIKIVWHTSFIQFCFLRTNWLDWCGFALSATRCLCRYYSTWRLGPVGTSHIIQMLQAPGKDFLPSDLREKSAPGSHNYSRISATMQCVQCTVSHAHNFTHHVAAGGTGTEPAVVVCGNILTKPAHCLYLFGPTPFTLCNCCLLRNAPLAVRQATMFLAVPAFNPAIFLSKTSVEQTVACVKH